MQDGTMTVSGAESSQNVEHAVPNNPKSIGTTIASDPINGQDANHLTIANVAGTVACTADLGRTAEAAASKPIQLIQPIYAKRVRAEVVKDKDPSQSIKRLCSLVSGVRATRQGTQ